MKPSTYSRAKGFLLGIIICLPFNTNASYSISSQTQISADIPFIENQGQLAQNDVAYYASTFGGSIFVKRSGEWIYHLPEGNNHKKPVSRSWAFQEKLVGSKNQLPVGENLSTTAINVLKGDKSQWGRNIPAYQSLSLVDVYPNIDLKLKASAKNIEKIFYIKPGADVSDINVQIDGVASMFVNDQQQLSLQTGLGQINFTAPVAFQMIDGVKSFVEVSYAINQNQYGFKVGDYDKAKTLIIDPLLASTFIGGNNTNAGSDFEQIHGIQKFGNNVFVAGMTDSSNFPTHLGLINQYNGGFYDGFVSKFSADLSTLLASTFIGGSGGDDIFGMTIDDAGNVYVVGRTASRDFPLTAGAYRYRANVSSGTYIAKLDNSLSSLLGTALVAGVTLPGEISLGNNSVYISGRTNRANIPVSANAFDDTCGLDGACDPSGSFGITRYYGYIERLNTDLTNLLAATYLDENGGSDVKISTNSNVYTVRKSAVNGTSIAAYTADLTTLVGSVAYPFNINFSDIAVADNFVVATGVTRNESLVASANAFDTGCGTDGLCDPTGPANYKTADMFIAKYSDDLQTTQALTYFGGSKAETSYDIQINPLNEIIVSGSTQSSNLPVSDNAFDKTANGAEDGFIAKFSSDLSSLLYATYIGGSNNDRPRVLAVVDSTQLYVAGDTDSTGFPVTTGSFDQTFNGGDTDAFVSLFDTVNSSGGTGAGGSGGAGSGGSNGGGSGSGNGNGSGGGSGGGATSNIDPVADAGSDRKVRSKKKVYLNGRNSSDADGYIVSYRWKQTSGKSVSLKRSRSAVAKFKSPKVKRGKTEELIFQLTVVDDSGASDTDEVIVRVRR